jgi:hypothetical protein
MEHYRPQTTIRAKSASGQKLTSRRLDAMSAVPSTTDFLGLGVHVRFVPNCDMAYVVRVEKSRPKAASQFKHNVGESRMRGFEHTHLRDQRADRYSMSSVA